MKRFVAQTGVILFLITILPLAYFLMKQESNLSENEEIVQHAFDQQLGTILYTINQNSATYIYSWVSQIDLPVPLESPIMKRIVSQLFENNQAIKQINFYSAENQETIKAFSSGGKAILEVPDQQMAKTLKKYAEQNYQKVKPIRKGNFTQLYFVLKSRDNTILAGISLHSKTFVEQYLKPDIQKISQEKFLISAIDTVTQTQIASVDTTFSKNTAAHSQELWYLPGIKIYISLRSATIDELVKARSKNDKYILAALAFIVLLGFVFVISSIRKEIRLAEIKSEFVSNVSHEIRTPLALISMYAETLLLGRVKNEEKKKEYFNIIFHETNRLTGMVNHILSFSKMEKGKRNFQYSDFDMNLLIEEICGNYQQHFKNNNVECNLELSGSNTTLHADRDSITECLINLIDNAVKYGKSNNKKVDIRTKWDIGSLVVEVEDNGIGISPKHQKQIFDKFYRVTQGNLAHKAKGSGLGLNIVQQIMKQHNGKIKVKSTLEKGSCFRLIFPANTQKNG